jgi:2-keto-4-pentenoate hydratase/2-oxohepta-3-ene-1,7-dioic acid hydratase in catechol pathway
MKIVRFETDDTAHLGVIDGDEIIDLNAVDPNLPNDLGQLLRGLDGDLGYLSDISTSAPSRSRKSMEGLRYALPIGPSNKIICLGLNYLEHLREGMLSHTSPKHPTIFMRIISSLVAHERPIVRPITSIQFDYEGELVAVVGRKAKHMTMENALSCIAGYSCCNEGSVRDFQRHTTQWGLGKNFDRSGSIGPLVVTADELPLGGVGLRIQSRLNGKVMQSDSTSSMMFSLTDTIVYLTKGIALEPGDLIVTGTPSGVGAARKPEPIWMRAGDIFEVDIEGIGILKNPIVDEKPTAM